ncbi:hypothetical protein [Polaromonas vacuolata]|uniref:hypothetical protein n=1 Tax=Polaromonas vacuolata TaxID=37448 RepID=UPI001456F8A6|nr:hypothetical protein [Polaromonas vacuolata]
MTSCGLEKDQKSPLKLPDIALGSLGVVKKLAIYLPLPALKLAQEVTHKLSLWA